ncbi:MAG: hypothetical protein WBF77_09900 [Sulfurimonadaceae bacterium]
MKDSIKVYSIHESHVYTIAKGKDHTPYEYGTKASIVTSYKSGVIVGVAAYDKNEHVSKTLDAALTSANANRDKPILEAVLFMLIWQQKIETSELLLLLWRLAQ